MASHHLSLEEPPALKGHPSSSLAPSMHVLILQGLREAKLPILDSERVEGEFGKS